MLEIEDLNVTFSLQWNQWSSNAATWNLKWRQRDSCEISLYVKDVMSTVDLYYKVFILKKFSIYSVQLFFYLYLVTTGISFFDLMFWFFFLFSVWWDPSQPKEKVLISSINEQNWKDTMCFLFVPFISFFLVLRPCIPLLGNGYPANRLPGRTRKWRTSHSASKANCPWYTANDPLNLSQMFTSWKSFTKSAD